MDVFVINTLDHGFLKHALNMLMCVKVGLMLIGVIGVVGRLDITKIVVILVTQKNAIASIIIKLDKKVIEYEK